jgi:hypothetical protein
MITSAESSEASDVQAVRHRTMVVYGTLDWRRVYALATGDLGGLDAFCATPADRARGRSS